MQQRAPAKRPTSPDVVVINRQFYDALWRKARLERPDGFNTWPLVSEFLPFAPARLEIGPGLRPRLPIAGTHFIDISQPAIERLNARGGIATASCRSVIGHSIWSVPSMSLSTLRMTAWCSAK
jgi:hypothetical protein